MVSETKYDRLGTALLAEKAPYLFTLFIGAVGWLISYTVARYEEIPVIAYSISQNPSSIGKQSTRDFEVSFSNISHTKAVACVALHLLSDKPQPDAESTIQADGGTMTGTSLMKRVNDPSPGELTISVMSMSPGASFRTQISVAPPAGLRVVEGPCKIDPMPSEAVVRPLLKEESFETWILVHSMALLWSGIVGWALALCALYCITLRGERNSMARASAPPVSPPSHDTSGDSPENSKDQGG